MRPSATVATPSFGRSRSGVRKPVAAMTSSQSNVSGPGQLVPRVSMREPVRRALHAFDRRVDDRRPEPAPHVLVERLQVAGAERRVAEHVGPDRTRRREDEAARPREQAVRDLEGGVALADDEDAPPAVLARRLHVDVVRRVLEPGDRGRPRRRHAEGEHDRAAAVLAVGRLEHEPAVVLEPCCLPRAAVAHAQPGTVDEHAERRLHLGARRHVVAPVHLDGRARLEPLLLGDEAVVVVELVLARAVRIGRVGLRPADQALEDGQTPEHAPRPVVGGEHGVVDAAALELVARLQPSRPAADHYDAVGPGFERPLYARASSIPRRRFASILSMRNITRGRSSRKRSTSGRGTTRQRRSESAEMSAVGA